MGGRRVVYTAITDRHARLSAHPRVPNTDFICYSDDSLARTDWDVRPVEASTTLSPRMRAKYHKLFPPKGYTWSVWVDGAYVMRTDKGARSFVDDLIARSPRGFGLHRHHARNCLFDEAAHSLPLAKCEEIRPIIEAQIAHYRREGHPTAFGLWGGGLLCRRDCSEVTAIMQRWWDDLLRWSWRDQLSLPVALRACGFQPDEWGWPLFKNPYMAGWEWNDTDRAVT